MHWLALLAPSSPTEERIAPPWGADRVIAGEGLTYLAWWSLQFTPKVALLEDAVVLEVQGSLRLFGGAAALHRKVWRGAKQAGMPLAGMAWAPTSLGALALARGGVSDGLARPLTELLDALPLHTLSAVQAHAPMLARLGLKRLGEVRRLPRAATARRFDTAMLLALDRAHGTLAEAHRWVEAPAQFTARLELPHRVEHAPVLLHYARHLLSQLCAWLAARHAGIRALTLHWDHDAMRARDVAGSGSLSLRTAEATRDFGHLSRLLSEHLARQELAAPVGEIRLSADEPEPLADASISLLPQASDEAREPLPQLLERMSVRLGPERVRTGCIVEDHRPEQMQQWSPWPGPARPRTPPRVAAYPQPSWLLDPPVRLAQTRDQPEYLGRPLQLVAGPQRVEGGWWSKGNGGHVQRDYFVYESADAGLLWVYQQRLSRDETGWFLHGVFA